MENFICARVVEKPKMYIDQTSQIVGLRATTTVYKEFCSKSL